MKNIYKINGKTYNSLDEIPEDMRKLLDAYGNGIPDLIKENADIFKDTKKDKVVFAAKKTEHKLIDENSPEYIEKMSRVKRTVFIGLIAAALMFIYKYLT